MTSDTQSRQDWRTWGILLLILAAGMLVRGVYLDEVADQPDFRQPLLDHLYHDLWARNLAFGDVRIPDGVADPMFAAAAYFRPPGYPFFLAAIYRVLGTNPYVPRIVQMLLGLASCLLAYTLAGKWLGKTVGLVSAGLTATSWVLIYYESKLHAPALLVFLALAMVWALRMLVTEWRMLYAFVAGLTLGLFAIVRPNILTFAPVALPWMWWAARGQAREKRFPKAALLFALGIVLVVASVTIRNAVVAHDPVLVSANGGINLFFGNHEGSNGIWAYHPETGAWNCFDYPRLVRDLSAKQGSVLSYSEASAHYAARARQFWLSDPLTALKLTGRKALLFWSPREVTSYGDVATERAQSKILRVLPAPFPLVAALALVGIVVLFSDIARRRRQAGGTSGVVDLQALQIAVLVLLLITTYSATLILFIVSARYRVPLLPFLFIFAAYAIVDLTRTGARRDFERLTVRIALVLLTWGVTSCNFAAYANRPEAAHLHRSGAHIGAGRFDAAIADLEQALRLDPRNAEHHHYMGHALAETKRPAEAIQHLQEAVRLDPGHVAAHAELGRVYMTVGAVDEAERAFRAALVASPSYDRAHLYLGSVLAVRGDTKGAEMHYREALRTNPGSAGAHVCLGAIMLESGRTNRGLRHMREALRYDPDNAEAKLCLEQYNAPTP